MAVRARRGAGGDIQRQLVIRDCFALAQREARQHVTAVADQDEGTAPHEVAIIGGDRGRHVPKIPPCLRDRHQAGDPLRPAALFDRLALAHHARVVADTDVVEKELIVDHPVIDGARCAATEHGDGLIELERNARIARKVIQRARRNDPKRLPRTRSRRGHARHGAIAACGDDHVVLASGAINPGLEVPAVGNVQNVGGHSLSIERLSQRIAIKSRPRFGIANDRSGSAGATGGETHLASAEARTMPPYAETAM
jgi:hypothetical protein